MPHLVPPERRKAFEPFYHNQPRQQLTWWNNQGWGLSHLDVFTYYSRQETEAFRVTRTCSVQDKIGHLMISFSRIQTGWYQPWKFFNYYEILWKYPNKNALNVLGELINDSAIKVSKMEKKKNWKTRCGRRISHNNGTDVRQCEIVGDKGKQEKAGPEG